MKKRKETVGETIGEYILEHYSFGDTVTYLELSNVINQIVKKKIDFIICQNRYSKCARANWSRFFHFMKDARKCVLTPGGFILKSIRGVGYRILPPCEVAPSMIGGFEFLNEQAESIYNVFSSVKTILMSSEDARKFNLVRREANYAKITLNAITNRVKNILK